MAFQIISVPPDALLASLQEVARPLWYMSETDAPVEILILPTTEVGEAFSTQDIERIFYAALGKPAPEKMSWEEANRLESNGTFSFFRDFPDTITTYPNNEYY